MLINCVDKNGVGPLAPSWVFSCEFIILWAVFKLQVLENFNSRKKKKRSSEVMGKFEVLVRSVYWLKSH